ncbi:MAG: sigma-70 family RNA polymerase sigma factor [Actinomycetota bacterium]|nr:sigma-70 family RNA polymerase sigma factor [Actinomycetota bacterium]
MRHASVRTPEPGWLFDTFADGVYTLAYRIIRDRHLAEDVVQETFIKVIHSLASYRGDGPIAAWIYRIGYHQAIAVTRRRREEPLDPIVVAVEMDRPGETVEEQVLAGELAARLDEAIGSLSESERAAFVLRDVEGLSTAEVAAALEISESAVKMRLARSREALRRQLKEYLT